MSSTRKKRQSSGYLSRHIRGGILRTSAIDKIHRSGHRSIQDEIYFISQNQRSYKMTSVIPKVRSKIALQYILSADEISPVDHGLYRYQKQANASDHQKSHVDKVKQKNDLLAWIGDTLKARSKGLVFINRVTLSLADSLPNIKQPISAKGRLNVRLKNESFQLPRSKYNV